MQIFLITLGIFTIFFLLMSVGVLLQGKCLKGTCGGINQQFSDLGCDICEGEDPESKLVCSNSEDCDKKDDCPLYKETFKTGTDCD